MLPVFLLITIVVLAGSTSAQSCLGRPNGSFVADPARCSFYATCANGVATRFQCPAGFHFNQAAQMCDYPSKASCLKCPPGGFKNVAVEGACRAFVQCFLGVATDRECPEGLLFDAGLGQCNLENKVQC